MSLSVFAYSPITLSGGSLVNSLASTENLMKKATSYSHSISVDGGYKSMSISIAATQSDISDWMLQGLGRHMVVMSKTGNIWEGMVNEIGIDIGGASLTIGPLIDMANRVYVTYTGTKWVHLGIPWGGEQETTDAANNTDSQAIYGIYEDYVSGGAGSEIEMNALRDVHLGDRSQPFIAQAQVNIEGGNTPSMTISCVGYSDILNEYRYSSSAITVSNVSDKIMDVVNADPSSRFSSVETFLTANTLQVSDTEEDQPTAITIIKSAVTLGDTSDRRYIFGIYNDRKVHYGPVEEEIYYVYNAPGNPHGIKKAIGGGVVDPWHVVPGKWLVITGISTYKSSVSSIDKLRENPAAMYIEEVTYTSPYGLSMSSGPTGKFAQKLARMGLALA